MQLLSYKVKKAYGLDDNKKSDKELIKNAVSEEFNQAFKLLEQTKLPVCFIRGIPHYDEGYQAKVAEHYIFLYFFYGHNNEASILVIDPQGSKFGDRSTDQNEKAIDEEFVDIIYDATNKSGAKLYVSADVIQQDGRSCGPISVELARAFYEVSGDREKKEKLFKALKESTDQSTKLSSDHTQKHYKLCRLGSDIISQGIIDDFSTKKKIEFTGSDRKSHYEDVGEEETRKKHHDIATNKRKYA